MKQTPEMLKSRAKKLRDLAQKLEEDTLIKIGRLTLRYFGTEGNVDLESFRVELRKLREGVDKR